MKYIVYKQPEDSVYPWEMKETIFIDSGYVLASISDANANILNWVKWSAIEVSEDLATGSLWAHCIIKNGQTERYRKWAPVDNGETMPTINSQLAGSSSDEYDDTIADSLKHVLSDSEIIKGGEWNKLIINRVVQEIFDSRFSALGVNDNALEASTYQVQLTEANAFILDDSVATPILDVLVANRDTDKVTLATNVIAADAAYNLKVASLLAEQKIVQDLIKSASGIDETLLLKEDLLGVMVESGLAILAGRAKDDDRTVTDDKYGVQF
jgi:hypothetical protein